MKIKKTGGNFVLDGYIYDLDCEAMITGICMYIHAHQIAYIKHVAF